MIQAILSAGHCFTQLRQNSAGGKKQTLTSYKVWPLTMNKILSLYTSMERRIISWTCLRREKGRTGGTDKHTSEVEYRKLVLNPTPPMLCINNISVNRSSAFTHHIILYSTSDEEKNRSCLVTTTESKGPFSKIFFQNLDSQPEPPAGWWNKTAT